MDEVKYSFIPGRKKGATHEDEGEITEDYSGVRAFVDILRRG
jgi:hypothetical protein